MFFLEEGFSDWFKDSEPVYYCVFETQNYDDSVFAQHNMIMPEHLSSAMVKRRAEYFAGRYCAIHCLRRFDINVKQILTGKNREPLWPESVTGSISHSKGYAVALVEQSSNFQGVGIDVEDRINTTTMNNILSHILDDSEVALIATDKDLKPLLFTLIFSVKECFFKACHAAVGRYFGFEAVSVIDIDMDRGRITLRLNDTLNSCLPKGGLIQGNFQLLSNKRVVTLIVLGHNHLT